MTLSSLEGENHIGSVSMQTAASNNLFFTDSSSLKRVAEPDRRLSHAGLYQGITQALVRGFLTKQSLVEVATRLASVADHAYLMRQFDMVGHIGRLLLSLPLTRQQQAVGHYYEALGLNRGIRGDTARACALFEQVADNASLPYKGRALLALGTLSVAAGDHHSAMSSYRETTRIVTRYNIFDPMTLYAATRMTAVIKGIDGDHLGAVIDLERMFPLARMASSMQPYAYYDYMNTLAVELGEAGRLQEARDASLIAPASPFANAYPEWRETRDEIELKGWRAPRSVIAFSETSACAHVRAGNLLRMPLAAHSRLVEPIRAKEHSPVLDMQAWKKKMTKEDEKPPRPVTSEEKQARLKELKKLKPREVIIKIMDKIGDEQVTDAQLLKALILLEELESLDDEVK